MAFIPTGALWYIAQVVLQITVEDESQSVVHLNYHLIRANSPDEAYDKAMRLGFEHESTYLNKSQKKVQIHFHGLRNLTVVYEPLEDKAELLYEQTVGLSREGLDSLVQQKESLGVFKPIERHLGPDYASSEIQQEARRMIEKADGPKPGSTRE